ncbi:MAG: outer membrane lipoprotein-sorting protein [Candidatus Dadabacteria bacterium]|nr:MAG: outer membrane lipoprotein-sorting protein [Candidatus Dadabacteria bacterium]
MIRTAVLLFVGLFTATFAQAALPDVQSLLADAYNGKGPSSMQAQMTMTLVDAGGKSVDRTLQIRRAGNDRQIVWFESPANMKGTGFLRLVEGGTEKMWLYLPAFKKLERIGATDKKRPFLGSDFAYADMAPHNLSDYSAKILGEGELDGRKVIHVELTLKNQESDALYGKIVSYIDAETHHVLREDLYDRAGDLIKQKSYASWTKVGAYDIPLTVEMKNMQNDHITRLTMADVKVDQKIADRVFSTKFLQKAR